MSTQLYIAGEDIEAGEPIAISPHDGMAYRVPPHRDNRHFPIATERLREGLRIAVTEGDVREDDA